MDVRSESLLSGRKGLVVGIANQHSIAYGCARVSELRRRTRGDMGQRKDPALRGAVGARAVGADHMPLDVEQSGAMEAVFDAIRERWGRLDCILHSIGFAPPRELHGRVAESSPKGFLRAMDISCHSFMRMARLAEPLMNNGGTHAHGELRWSERGRAALWLMGLAKAALEAAVRYLATELGPQAYANADSGQADCRRATRDEPRARRVDSPRSEKRLVLS